MSGVVADRVIVELEAKLDKYNANVLKAQQVFERGMGRMQDSAKRTEGLVTSSFRRMGGAFGAYLGANALLAGARGFLSYVDAAKQLSAQLKLATKDTGNFAVAQRDVQEIAAATRSDINAVGTLYSKLARSAKDLGITQETVAQVTTAVSQSFLISGASAVEAAQGTRQLIQGFQSGVLRGDEFNSVMELAPRLARLLADSLNVPIGQLRAMAEAGELTADKLVKALSDRRFTAGLEDEFKQLPVTFDQAMVLVSNAAQQTFSAFDSGGQFSQSLANFVTDGADGFSDLATSAEQLGIDIASAMAGLSDAFEPMISGAMRAFGIIGSEADGLARAIADVLGAIDTVANAVPNIANGIRRGGRSLGLGSLFRQDDPDNTNLRGNFLSGYNKRKGELSEGSLKRRLNQLPGFDPKVMAGFLADPQHFDETHDQYGNPTKPGPGVRIAKSGGAKKKGRKGPSAETLANRAERERLQQAREDEAFRQDLARTNEDILAAKAAISTAAEAIAAAEIAQLESERSRTNEAYKADVVQKRLTETQAAELTEANNRLASLKIQAVQLREQERIRAEGVAIAQADRQNELDMAEKVGALADTRAEQRDVALRILDLQYDIERAELENVIASRESTAAQKEIARRRLAILGQLQAADKASVERQNEGPGARFLRELNADDINDQLEKIRVDGLQSLEDQLTDTIGKVFQLGGAFGKVANQIISDLIRIAVRKAIVGPIANLLFGGGSGGGIGGIIASVIGGVASGGKSIGNGKASGGHVRAGQIYQVNENGVEGFQPAQSGKIIPLGRMRGGGGGGGTTVLQTFVLDARYGITTPELLRHVNQVATQRASQAGHAAYDAGQKAFPGRAQKFQKLGS